MTKFLLAALVDVHGVLVEGESVVNSDAEVFKAINYLYWLVVDEYGVVWSNFAAGVNMSYFFLMTLRRRWLSAHQCEKCVTVCW